MRFSLGFGGGSLFFKTRFFKVESDSGGRTKFFCECFFEQENVVVFRGEFFLSQSITQISEKMQSIEEITVKIKTELPYIKETHALPFFSWGRVHFLKVVTCFSFGFADGFSS